MDYNELEDAINTLILKARTSGLDNDSIISVLECILMAEKEQAASDD